MEPIFSHPDLNTRLNRTFAYYLEGKSVAIVGRAGIHEMEQGEFIDSHDVVVRVHWVVPYNPSDNFLHGNTTSSPNDPVEVGQMVPAEWQSRLGKRVNVFYHRLRQSKPRFWRQFIPIFQAAGGQFLCNDCTGSQHIWQDAMARKYLPVRYVSWEIKDELRLEMEQEPLSGSVCIADILSHNVKSAYLTGFICHFNEDFPHYDLPLYAGEREKGRKQKARSRLPDLRFLARMNKDERVTVDSNMQFLFDKYSEDV